MRTMMAAGSLLLVLSGGAMAAQVFKWVDAQGITHFGSQPPSGQMAEAVGTLKAPPAHALAVPVEPSTITPPKDPAQQAIDLKVRQDIADQEAQRQKACETLRTNLAHLKNNPRLQVEEDGKMRRLPEEERQSRIAETEKKIAEHCQ